MADRKRDEGASGTGLAAWLLDFGRRIARNGLGNLQRGRGQRRMELVETLQLGGKRQLMLVVCDGQRYLVGAGGDAVHSIEAVGARVAEEDGRMVGVESDSANSFSMGRAQ